ncbi:MAG: hypothetical protein HFF50_05135 [Lawsonibacter sp.]|nr:hypothetical protein [Lawsonibacter sp.]
MSGKNRKTYRIAVSAAAWLLCALSSSFGYSFLSGMLWPFPVRFLVGFLLMAAPVLVLSLIFELFRKEN